MIRWLRRLAGPGHHIRLAHAGGVRPEVHAAPEDHHRALADGLNDWRRANRSALPGGPRPALLSALPRPRLTFSCECGGTCGHCAPTVPPVAQAAEPTVLTADAGEPDAGLPARWHAYLFVEGLRTVDGRAAQPDAGTWRDLPLPLAWAKENEGGHWGSVVVGSIETVERQQRDSYVLIYAEGTFDLGSEEGQEVARQVALQGGTRWVSADIERIESEYVMVDGGIGDDDILDILFGEADWYELLTAYRVLGATVVSTPAFPQCVIAPAGVALPEVEPMAEAEQERPMLVAAAVRPPAEPPAAWFDNPNLAGPTPLTVGDDGRVYGHLATWGTCHTAFQGRCVTPPRGAGDYSWYRTGVVRTAEGADVNVGQLTVDCGHAAASASHRSAAAHYDNTGHACADVAAGDDDHGIWVAGALRPDVTEEQVRTLRASTLSGDWRTIAGNLELVAALAVNVGGFPIPRSLAAAAVTADLDSYRPRAGMRGDLQVSLVAAGRVERNPVRDVLAAMAGRLQDLERRVETVEQPAIMASLEAQLAG